MNLILLEASELDAEGRAVLRDRRAEHIRSVLRAEPGQNLHMGVLGVGKAEGRVLEVAESHVLVELPAATQPDAFEVEAPAEVDLILALPRPQVLHRILQYATVFGVGRIDLIRTWRVEKSYFSSPSLAPAEIRRQLLLGAEQGQWSRLPVVEVHPRFKDFLETLEGERQGLLAELGAPRDLAATLETVPTPSGRWVIAIGPEGGWIDREVAAWIASGFLPFSLGPWNLRVEMALVAGLAQLALLRRLAANREQPP